MANDRREFILTRHVRERFVQRTNKKFAKLQWTEYEPKDLMDALTKELEKLLEKDGQKIDDEIFQLLENSKNSRSFINNSGFMGWYYDKYGYDKRFEFWVNQDILFVVVVEKGRKIVVTCVEAKTHMAGKAVLANRRKKFRKKKKDDYYER